MPHSDSLRHDAPAVRKTRDLRLDFFRGLALFIILIDHTRGNTLASFMPAQFGFSDAACVFFFVSGASCAHAFGSVFRRAGWGLGTARVSLRVWQIYVAQIALVLAVTALPGFLRQLTGGEQYVNMFELHRLFDDPVGAFWGVVSLTYVPGYLDILPVYVVVLAMVPVGVLLAEIDGRLAVGASVALWLGASLSGMNLPADFSTGRHWYFNPFCWQLVFFTGYALTAGWIPVPRRNNPWLWTASVGVLVFGVFARVPALYGLLPGGAAVHGWAMAHMLKTPLMPLTYLHFLALAYVVVGVIGERTAFMRRRWSQPFLTAGAQSLPVFIATVLLSDLGTAALEGRGTWDFAQVIVNLYMLLALAGIAWVIAWYKSAPWNAGRVPGPRISAEPVRQRVRTG